MKLLLVAVLVLSAAALSAQPPQMPTPGPEQKALERWVGTWNMEGTMQPSPLGPGGQFTGTETCRMFEGGWHLVCDSKGTGPWGPMQGHTIMTYDAAAKEYRYFAISNMMHAELATGTRDGKTWTWRSKMDMGGQPINSRFVIVEASPTSDTMKWEMSIDGKSWATAMEAKSTKTSK